MVTLCTPLNSFHYLNFNLHFRWSIQSRMKTILLKRVPLILFSRYFYYSLHKSTPTIILKIFLLFPTQEYSYYYSQHIFIIPYTRVLLLLFSPYFLPFPIEEYFSYYYQHTFTIPYKRVLLLFSTYFYYSLQKSISVIFNIFFKNHRQTGLEGINISSCWTNSKAICINNNCSIQILRKNHCRQQLGLS